MSSLLKIYFDLEQTKIDLPIQLASLLNTIFNSFGDLSFFFSLLNSFHSNSTAPPPQLPAHPLDSTMARESATAHLLLATLPLSAAGSAAGFSRFSVWGSSRERWFPTAALLLLARRYILNAAAI